MVVRISFRRCHVLTFIYSSSSDYSSQPPDTSLGYDNQPSHSLLLHADNVAQSSSAGLNNLNLTVNLYVLLFGRGVFMLIYFRQYSTDGTIHQASPLRPPCVRATSHSF
jgi:hypothetical protein